MNSAIAARVPRLRPLAAALAIAFAMSTAVASSGTRDAVHPRDHAALGVPIAESVRRARADGVNALTPFTDRRPQGTVVVANCDDAGPGSLRDAYFNAVDDQTIDLSQLPCSTITLTTGALTNSPSTTDVTLQGPGKYQLTIDGSHNGRVLVHNGSGQMSLNGLTVTNGSYSGTYGGGCIYSYGSVALFESLVSSCSMSSSGSAKANGGAIYARGNVAVVASQVIDSTAHAASANSAGGGVWADSVGIYMSTISGNTVSGDGSHYARGGGVYSLGDTQIKYSTLADNDADAGAGAFLVGAVDYTMAIGNSTISGNHASGAGGGVYAKYRPLEVSNSTITQNTAGFQVGAGIYLASDTDIESTIIANNTSQDGLYASDLGGNAAITVSGANNLIRASTLPVPPDTIDGEPMLGPLQNNGGFTMTHALLAGSPAIDHGNNLAGRGFDQRAIDYDNPVYGYERTVGSNADIGAFEFGAPDHIFVDSFDTPPP